MTFGGFNDNLHPAPMSEINVTPMVDVMLVLLVIFILAAPMFTQAIKLDLPSTAAGPAPVQPSTITLSIDGAGLLYWNDTVVSASELPARMQAAAQQQPAPELQLRADRATRYEVIAQVMAAAQGNGLQRIGFVTEPLAVPVAAAPLRSTPMLSPMLSPQVSPMLSPQVSPMPSPALPPAGR
jgi:biopolymer transport protein ExbD